MKIPKKGDRVRVHNEFKDKTFPYDRAMYDLRGKVCICLTDTGEGYVDVSEQSSYRLGPDDYTIIGFEDYLNEIESGEK